MLNLQSPRPEQEVTEGGSGGCSTPLNPLKNMAVGQESSFQAESLRTVVSRILESPELVHSDRLRQLLSYLAEAAIESRAGHIKETVIGVEVFGRDPGYDPKIDGIVRTEARRLRLKLLEYYLGSGRHDRVRIELPKGGYIPVFVHSPEPPSAAPAATSAAPAATSAAPAAVQP